MEKDNILFLQQFFGNEKGKEIVKKRNEIVKDMIKSEENNIHKECNLKIHNLYNINKNLVKDVKDLKCENESLQKQYNDLSSRYNELLEWKDNHVCSNDIIKSINIKESNDYIELNNLNNIYNEKILKLESDIKNIKLNSNIEDNALFIQIRKQNQNLLDSNNELDAKVKELNLKIEYLSTNSNVEDPILEIKSTDVVNSEMDVIHKENINKIIIKMDKLYTKTFSDEQININKSLISLYSKIYNLIKDKDEKKDAIYINDILDSASTDTNKARFKKIIKIANFINNHEYLNKSRIVIPLYMFKGISINSIDDLFSSINDHYKDKIIMDGNQNNSF